MQVSNLKMNYPLALINKLQKNFELIVWITALVLLYFMKSNISTQSLCLFKWINSAYCPGCGLGHSIHAALHLQLSASLQLHPMGIAAVLIILNRIKQLILKLKPVLL